MKIKELVAIYILSSFIVILLQWLGGLISPLQAFMQLIMLTIPTEVTILRVLPNIIGVIVAFAYIWLSENASI